MKRIYIAIVAILVASFSACKKDAYLTDDGLHQAEVNMSTYDYLASHPKHMFDTLLQVIDHFGLKDEINNAKTFWVPSDYSISRAFKMKKALFLEDDENGTYTFADFLTATSVDSVRAYFYGDGQHSLTSANTTYTTMNNNTPVTGFAFNKQKQPQGQWSYQDVYYLYYIKVRGEPDQTAPDGSVRVDRNDQADVRVLCQTTGIKTASGTVLNVLSNQHVFISDFNETGDNGPFIEDLPNGIRFTYSVAFKAASAYTGGSVVASSAWIADAFGLEADDIPGLMGSSIVFYAIEPGDILNGNSTANAPGHWFDANGNVVTWGTTARLFSEYNASTFTFNIGQYPDRSAMGDTYTIKQALVYTNRSNEKIRAEFVFNIKIN
ncbi:DUF4859 domain-containing protein [Sphingobacterium psychroaquaticum]|uniref:DUF4859 domain-containing protein n=1 Tax=Sphingobacterium psychroaquaticum TaxID=561061 RepID=A0A1X7I5T1_9SPHI|nr:DUF4859 domain-containing protein [Sphingobacterium psychroaquaticum]SMG09217.1 protein of unknown function [Sphingobacterium psychroaquaticum]